MAVRFVLGRAGTGKTAHCIDAIVRALVDHPLGPPLYFIVPDQSTFNVERQLIAHPDIRGTFRAHVTSFRHLSSLLGEELGIAPRADLDDLARIILLTDLVANRKPDLQLFGPASDRPGFILRLDAMLKELQQSAHTGGSLRAIATDLTGPAGTRDPILSRKLHDLALLLDGWDALLAERQLPSERLQDIVAARLHELPDLKHAQLWVDGFSGFSQLEVRLLLALARHCAHLTITLTLDPQSPTIRNPAAQLDDLSLFHRTERAYRSLHAAFEKEGIPVADPLRLTQRHRFANSPALDRIEFGLFTPATPHFPDTAAPADISLWQCDSPLTEVRAAAQHIRQLMTDPANPLRYRDIALVIPDLDSYADAVRRIFNSHSIPHFIDQRRSIAHHPLVELLRCAVSLPLNQFTADDIAILLKTGLTPINEHASHLFENYMLAHGLSRVDLHHPFGFLPPAQDDDADDEPMNIAPTEAQAEALRTVDDARITLLAGLKRWLAITTQSTTGEAFAEGLKLLLQDLHAAEALDTLVATARQANDVELVAIHTQAYNQILALIDTLAQLLRGRPTTLDEFAHLLTSALENLTLGLIPPTLDQVLVSSVTRSRHPELKIAIVLGALESRFPMVRAEDPLLNDHQREAFNARTPHLITPGSDRQLLEARYLDYIAFTRASEKLIVSHPVADAQGKAVTPSPYIAKLTQLFPKLTPRLIAPEDLHALERISTRDDALAASLLWARHLENAPPDSPISASPESELFALLSTDPDPATRRAADRALPSLTPAPDPILHAALAEKFYPSPIRMSVSQLERYAACPLQYFLIYTLGLKERPKLQLDVMNMGTLYHAVLEKFFNDVLSQKLPWPTCDIAQLTSTLQRAADAAAKELHRELAGTMPQYPRILARVVRTLTITLEGQRRAALAGLLRPAATELSFGDSRDPRRLSLPVLPLRTPAGRTAHLNGKIDRVDLAPDGDAAVIDYKSSAAKQLDLHLLLHGIQLQLPIYLWAIGQLGTALQRGPLQPVAAFFVPLARPRTSHGDPATESEPSQNAFYQTHPPRGVMDVAAISELETDKDPAEPFIADWYKARRNKNGELAAKSNDAYEHNDFNLVLQFTRMKSAQIIDALAEGRIAPLPYRAKAQIPCDYCDVKDMCAFDRIRGAFFNLEKLKPHEALAAMRTALSQNPAGGAP